MVPVVGGQEVGVKFVGAEVKEQLGLPSNADFEVSRTAARQALVVQCSNFAPSSLLTITTPEVSGALLSLCVSDDSNQTSPLHTSPSHVFEFSNDSRLSLPKASTPVGIKDAKELIRALEGGVKLLKNELYQIEQVVVEGCIRTKRYVYDGQLKGAKRHGLGKCSYFSGFTVTGEWREGLMHGHGLSVCSDTIVPDYIYEGDFENGRFHGFGVMSEDVGVYSGNWVKGHKNGCGRMVYANGDRYSGHWVEGKRIDKNGLYVTSEGHVYQGEWVGHFEALSSDFFVHPTRNDLYITTKLCLLFLSYKNFRSAWNEELTHTLLVKILDSLGHDKAKAIIENKVKIDEYIKACQEKQNVHGALISTSIVRHAFLLRVRVGEEGELDFILLDSGSGEYVRDKKTKTGRVFRLKDKEQLILVLQSLRVKTNFNEFRMYLQASGKFKELVESCLVQRVQKIGSCTLDCWLTAIRFDLTNDIEWLNLRIDLFRYVRDHCHKMISLSSAAHLKDRFSLYSFKAEKKIMRRQKKLASLLANSR